LNAAVLFSSKSPSINSAPLRPRGENFRILNIFYVFPRLTSGVSNYVGMLLSTRLSSLMGDEYCCYRSRRFVGRKRQSSDEDQHFTPRPRGSAVKTPGSDLILQCGSPLQTMWIRLLRSQSFRNILRSCFRYCLNRS